MLNVFDIRKNKSLRWIESKRNNILNVIDAHSDCTFWSFEFELGSVNVLLIVGDLNHKRNIERILQVFSEDKRNSVTEM